MKFRIFACLLFFFITSAMEKESVQPKTNVGAQAHQVCSEQEKQLRELNRLRNREEIGACFAIIASALFFMCKTE